MAFVEQCDGMVGIACTVSTDVGSKLAIITFQHAIQFAQSSESGETKTCTCQSDRLACRISWRVQDGTFRVLKPLSTSIILVASVHVPLSSDDQGNVVTQSYYIALFIQDNHFKVHPSVLNFLGPNT